MGGEGKPTTAADQTKPTASMTPTHQEIAQNYIANRDATSFNDRAKKAVTTYGDFLIGAGNNPDNVVYSKAPTQTERQKFEADYMRRLQSRNIDELSQAQRERLEAWQKTHQN